MANKKEIEVRHRSRSATVTSPSKAPDEAPAAAQAPTGDQAADYDVGYGKTPPDTRYKPGQSGNPKGRPKGSKNLKTDLAEEMQERVQVREGGKTQTVSKQRAMVKSLTAKAVHGDARAMVIAFDLMCRLLHADEAEDTARGLSPDDKAILKAYAERLLRKLNEFPEDNKGGGVAINSMQDNSDETDN